MRFFFFALLHQDIAPTVLENQWRERLDGGPTSRDLSLYFQSTLVQHCNATPRSNHPLLRSYQNYP
jgi:hypothetical protein